MLEPSCARFFQFIDEKLWVVLCSTAGSSSFVIKGACGTTLWALKMHESIEPARRCEGAIASEPHAGRRAAYGGAAKTRAKAGKAMQFSRPHGLMDTASVFGTKDSRFEFCQGSFRDCAQTSLRKLSDQATSHEAPEGVDSSSAPSPHAPVSTPQKPLPNPHPSAPPPTDHITMPPHTPYRSAGK